MQLFLLTIASLSLLIWVILLAFWGQFWRSNQKLGDNVQLTTYPSVCAVIPARNEAEALPLSLPSLLAQDYPGTLDIILVDDQSSDNTAKIAQEIAQGNNQPEKLKILSGKPLAAGWTGKLWAMSQGISYALEQSLQPDYFLFTDADIEHDTANLTELVNKAETEALDLVSLMVLLRCQSFWEKLLIPAFVFFFQKLYPFPWVNNPRKTTAAAAGGCILIRREALQRIGGIQAVRQALIDDCALGGAVKSSSKTGIWLGLTTKTRSLRPYPNLASVWDMVARTAFTQLEYSPLLLLGTLFGMGIIYLLPPLAIFAGLFLGNWLIAAIGLLTWLLMSCAYFPTTNLYSLSPLWAIALPLIAFLYTLMTFDSAWRYWRGRGGEWKGRVYAN